ncbi:MAG: tRNA pseudouridine(55) synthase TruB [Gammaproteobacteria bacterium]
MLLLDKPIGLTSNAVLQQVRRLFRARKAGHTGSLDPLASGMLPICFGHATKLSAYLLDANKTYRVTARFGARTDTADADGQIVEESPVTRVDREALETAMSGLRGEILQVPPMYSALKKDGKRLYELARAGQEVERKARPVTIHEFEIETWDPRQPVMRVRCSKGTYVRTLVEDLAAAAGTLGHVTALRRSSVDPFPPEGLVTIAELEAAAAQGTDELDRYLRQMDEAIDDWPAVYLNSDQAYYLRHGNPVHAQAAGDPGLVRLYDADERFFGVGEVLRDGRLAPKRLFLDAG